MPHPALATYQSSINLELSFAVQVVIAPFPSMMLTLGFPSPMRLNVITMRGLRSHLMVNSLMHLGLPHGDLYYHPPLDLPSFMSSLAVSVLVYLTLRQ